MKYTAEQVLAELERQYHEELRALPALSTRQAARAIGVSEATVKRLCNSESLCCIRTPGGHRKVSAQSVADYLNHNDMEMGVNPDKPIRYALGVDLAARDGDTSGVCLVSQRPDGTRTVEAFETATTQAELRDKIATMTVPISEDDPVELEQ